MAGEKFLYNNAGVITEKVSTQAGSTGNENKIPSLDSTGRLNANMLPIGVAPETDEIEIVGSASAGDYINIYDSTGVKCRKADATTAGKEANGFVLDAYLTGATAKVYRISQSNTALSGMTPGKKQYLSTVAGGRTETIPSSSGNVVQELGIAVSATVMIFAPKEVIVLA